MHLLLYPVVIWVLYLNYLSDGCLPASFYSVKEGEGNADASINLEGIPRTTSAELAVTTPSPTATRVWNATFLNGTITELTYPTPFYQIGTGIEWKWYMPYTTANATLCSISYGSSLLPPASLWPTPIPETVDVHDPFGTMYSLEAAELDARNNYVYGVVADQLSTMFATDPVVAEVLKTQPCTPNIPATTPTPTGTLSIFDKEFLVPRSFVTSASFLLPPKY
ncbi:hypothetical protein NA57DRAFT_79558 [Rhizodiscina lignyota]|uniref:Uncharacterized protein n=1 Tax=Rhizodiscina lignyota TaxID=1504668 RepID=A0A9P4I6Z2_9PEZI|nr:hypothetical protein NA57DRAFT_79558 [Rhizodiscina lignyota]